MRPLPRPTVRPAPTATGAVAAAAALALCLLAPGARAEAAPLDGPATAGPATTASATMATTTTTTTTTATPLVTWSMDSSGGVVRDGTSGLTLGLQGRWTQLAGAVAFGAATPSLGVSDDGGRLSPGTADFAVAVTMTTASVPRGQGYSPNVVQKGFASSGGQWKLTLRPTSGGTRAACRFEGRSGSVLVRDSAGGRLDDGRSHVVACWRAGGVLGVTVDGRSTQLRRDVGAISPRTATTVANKRADAGADDQLVGSVACVAMALGAGSRDLALSRAGC
ncbi:hypothetical protein [Terracoccus luteus]|uniref:Concanavalin A-like lectin/glucanase superfamily protein n=1 Tax=Terracoccus luteus TaxID=53356 RepID=A0A839PPM2_9MICO|nr:hypothetical protein [Terracoccus luteus]MBB2984943.1 hypothetical protein [Terracoccus luteus]MCP2170595.1 hypothetical protein [Terracoccus luteus]